MVANLQQIHDEEEDDLYAQLKALQRQEEFLDIQEEYIKDEMRNLKRELIRAREVPDRTTSPTKKKHIANGSFFYIHSNLFPAHISFTFSNRP